jgi:hypothetical protein
VATGWCSTWTRTTRRPPRARGASRFSYTSVLIRETRRANICSCTRRATRAPLRSSRSLRARSLRAGFRSRLPHPACSVQMGGAEWRCGPGSPDPESSTSSRLSSGHLHGARDRCRRRVLRGFGSFVPHPGASSGRDADAASPPETAAERPTCGATLGRPVRAWGCSSVGRAPAWHAGGRGFESPQLHWFHDIASRADRSRRPPVPQPLRLLHGTGLGRTGDPDPTPPQTPRPPRAAPAAWLA